MEHLPLPFGQAAHWPSGESHGSHIDRGQGVVDGAA